MDTHSQNIDELFESIENDPRVSQETLFTSRAGITITAVSASMSIVGSYAIILVIKRSSEKLNSVYHRIIFMMSIFDIIQSFAMALTTLPMPADMIYHQYQGVSIGSVFTCNLQGFFIGLGTLGSLMYNAVLSIYYFSIIRNDMSDEKFCKRFEPCLNILAILVTISMNVPSLVYQLFNPQPMSTVWCGYGSLPWWCEIGHDCLTPTPPMAQTVELIKLLHTLILPFILATIIVMFMLIVVKVEQLKRTSLDTLDVNDSNEFSRRAQRIQIRIIEEAANMKKQAFLYSLNNTFGFAIAIIIPIVRNFIPSSSIASKSITLRSAYVTLRPMQGLFNFLIFIFLKAWNLQQADYTLTTKRALAMALKGSEPRERAVLDLELVREHDALDHLTMADIATEGDGEVEEVRGTSLSLSSGGRVVPSQNTSKCTSNQDLSGFPVIAEDANANASIRCEDDDDNELDTNN